VAGLVYWADICHAAAKGAEVKLLYTAPFSQPKDHHGGVSFAVWGTTS